jgi:hypothetical protein
MVDPIKKTKTISGHFLLLILLMPACQEVYLAELDNVEPLLVVDGLITDNPGPHQVRVSFSNRFQDEAGMNPISNAALHIESGDGLRTELHEDPLAPGTYLTPGDFSGMAGTAYILHIETPDGETYRSDPQMMTERLSVDSVYIESGQMVFYRKSRMSNTVYRVPVEGFNFFLRSEPANGDEQHFRFRSFNYMQWTFPAGDFAYWINWWQWDATDFLEKDLGKASSEPSAQQVGFLPLANQDFFYFGFNLTEDSLKGAILHSARVLSNRIYSLNDDSHAFHKARNEQLNNEGRFFDPIASQPLGNIRCTSDPEKIALGHFETSAEVAFTYRVVTNFTEGTRHLVLLESFEPKPRQGRMLVGPPNYTLPPWWIP